MIYIQEDNICKAWEQSLLAVLNDGQRYSSEDGIHEKYGHDATLAVKVNHPFEEPRIHKCFPGGLEDLWIYRDEVLNGIKDHLVGTSDTAWEYTYHERISRNSQIIKVAKILSDDPYSRQGVIRIAESSDIDLKDPPCLQYITFRVDNIGYLNMTTHWRSRDLFKAWIMNVFAMTELFQRVYNMLCCMIEVEMGYYLDVSDSAHIHGRDINDAWLEALKYGENEEGYINRSYNTHDDIVQEIKKEVYGNLSR